MELFYIIKSNLSKKVSLLLLVATLFCVGGTVTSCGSNKTGCPMNESQQGKVNKKGQLSSKKGKSNLFPKKMRKKMRVK
ncbi:MAG: hypothetical protein AAGJ18_26320 [Bacteroidota bacterium]